MSGRIIKLLVAIILVSIVSYVFLLNPGPVTVSLGRSTTWTAPLALVLVVVFCLGVVVTAIVSLLFGIRTSLHTWQERRKNRLSLDHLEGLVSVRERFAVGEYDDAIPALRKMISQDPANIVARNMLAEALEQKGDFREALAVLDDARASQKKNLEWLFRGAEIHAALGNLTASCDNLVLVLASQPDNRAALERLVSSYSQLGRYQEAVEYQRRLMRVVSGDDASVMMPRLAELELKTIQTQSNGEDLRPQLEQLLKRHRDFPAAIAEIARLERDRSNLDEASELWTKAYKTSRDRHYLEQLALMWLKVERPEKAVSSVRAALAPQKGKAPAPITDELFLVALLQHVGMHDDTQKELDRIQARGDMSPDEKKELEYFRALSLHRRGRDEEAFAVLRDAAGARGWNRLASVFTDHGDKESEELWSEESRLKFRAQAQPSPELSTP